MGKRRRKRQNTAFIISLAVILLMVSFGAMYWFFNNTRLLWGTWHRQIDITKEVTANIEKYLAKAELSEEIDVSSIIEPVTVEITMVLQKNGVYEEKIDEAAYEKSVKDAEKALKESIEKLILLRLSEEEIETDYSPEELLEKTLPMGTDSYLEEYGPQLMPVLSELRGLYNNNGNYVSTRERITLTDVLGQNITPEQGSPYIVSENYLLINSSNEQLIYYR